MVRVGKQLMSMALVAALSTGLALPALNQQSLLGYATSNDTSITDEDKTTNTDSSNSNTNTGDTNTDKDTSGTDTGTGDSNTGTTTNPSDNEDNKGEEGDGSGSGTGSGTETDPGTEEPPVKDPPPIENPPPVVKDPPKLPSCSLSSKTLATSSFTVRIGSIGDLKLEYALMNAGSRPTDSSWKKSTSTDIDISKSGTWDFYYRVTDPETELTTTSSSYRIYYDTKAPKSPTISTDTNSSEQRIYIIFECTEDTGSPIDRIYYRIDGSSWKSYSSKNSVYISREGSYVVEAYCIDECGNESSIAKKTLTFKFEDFMELPTVRMLDKSPTSSSVRFKLSNYNSDIYDYEYKFVSAGSKAGTTDWNYCTGSTVMTIDEEGSWDLQIRMSYKTYTKNGKVASCVIDRTAPVIKSIKEVGDKSARSITLGITASDDKTSDKNLKYSFDNGKNWQTSNQKVFRTATTINVGDIQVKDECGNIGYANYSCEIDVVKNEIILDEKPLYKLNSRISVKDSAVNNGYIRGVGDNRFAPDNSITRAELMTILSTVIDFSKANTIYNNISYTDVEQGQWYYTYVTQVQKYQVIDTVGGMFNPSQPVTRAEFAHAIAQILDMTNISIDTNPFIDIDNSRYKTDIQRIAAIGLVEGYGKGKFGPDDTLTRAQVVTVINKIIGAHDIYGIYNNKFSDVPETHWAYKEILNATYR